LAAGIEVVVGVGEARESLGVAARSAGEVALQVGQFALDADVVVELVAGAQGQGQAVVGLALGRGVDLALEGRADVAADLPAGILGGGCAGGQGGGGKHTRQEEGLHGLHFLLRGGGLSRRLVVKGQMRLPRSSRFHPTAALFRKLRKKLGARQASPHCEHARGS
jgi:hypothetical protein